MKPENVNLDALFPNLTPVALVALQYALEDSALMACDEATYARLEHLAQRVDRIGRDVCGADEYAKIRLVIYSRLERGPVFG